MVNADKKILLGTGWFSAVHDANYITCGSSLIRSLEFRPFWWYGVKNFLRPNEVLVIDSASPVELSEFSANEMRVQQLVLPSNPGHSQTTSQHYCGWTASVLISLEYAIASDFDIFVYVEQDVLLYGSDLRDEIIKKVQKSPVVFGDGADTPQVLQQSFFAIERRSMRPFLSGLHMINSSDGVVSPESKFHIALAPLWARRFLTVMELCKAKRNRQTGLIQRVNFFLMRYFSAVAFRLTRRYSFWDFGYGRSRPVNFGADSFYFQHGSEGEIHEYLRTCRDFEERVDSSKKSAVLKTCFDILRR